MNTDLIIAVLSLAGLQIGLVAWLRADMRSMEGRIESRLASMEGRLATLEGRLTTLERSQAKLEGLLEGLRDAISLRSAA